MTAAKKEIENFYKRDAWEVTPLSKLKPGQRPVKTKWIFKKKDEHDGSIRYKGRIVVKGYSQIPGIDYTFTHSPVASDIAIRLTLAVALLKAKEGWIEEMIDIEAAFLEAELAEDLYIEFPKGLVKFGFMTESEQRGKCIKLKRAMYGACQSPRAYYDTATKHFKSIGLQQCKAEPCLWYKTKNGKLSLLMVTFVDDIICVAKKEDIEELKQEIRTRFNISELGRLSKHLGIYYEKKKDEISEYFELGMDKYFDEVVRDYEALRGKVPLADTPGFPGESLVRQLDEPIVELKPYRRILGKTMWSTLKILPETANATRELSVSMDHPTEIHWKALGRLIGYIKKARLRLKIRKPVDLRIRGFSDSNYATNKDTRRSVTGYILTLGGALLTARSVSQRSTSLSSCESEYVAASTAAVDIKYIQMILEELFPAEETSPAELLIDNMAALHLIENDAVGSRTKHIDVKMHHIKEMRRGPKPRLVVKYVRTEENMADLQTKNVTEKLNTKLGNRLKNGDFMTSFPNKEDTKYISSILSAAREDVERHVRTQSNEYVDTFVDTLTGPNIETPTEQQRSVYSDPEDSSTRTKECSRSIKRKTYCSVAAGRNDYLVRNP